MLNPLTVLCICRLAIDALSKLKEHSMSLIFSRSLSMPRSAQMDHNLQRFFPSPSSSSSPLSAFIAYVFFPPPLAYLHLSLPPAVLRVVDIAIISRGERCWRFVPAALSDGHPLT